MSKKQNVSDGPRAHGKDQKKGGPQKNNVLKKNKSAAFRTSF